MKELIIWIGILAVVIVGGWFLVKNRANTPVQAPASAGPIKIGAALSLSGIAAQDGESIQQGIELAKTDLKKKGVDVEVVYQDDKTEPKSTVSAINALYAQGVQAIIGPTWSYLADAGIPVADRLRIVTVGPANTSEYVQAKSPYSFFTTTKVANILPVLVDWLGQNNVKNIAIISNQGAWYDAVTGVVRKAAEQSGAKIIFSETMTLSGSEDAMPTVIAKLKGVKVDLVFTEIDDDKGITIMLKKMKEQKVTSPIMSVTTSISRVLSSNKDLGLGNNFYVVSPKSSKEFEDEFFDYYKQKPGAYADRAYDSLMLLVEAIQNKGELPLEQYLREKTDYSGYAGRYKFDENGDIVGGEWVVQSVVK